MNRCWRCHHRTSDIRGAACRPCRRVIYACYAVLWRRGRIMPGDETRNAHRTLTLAALWRT